MCLQYKLSRAETARQYLQQINNPHFIAMKVNSVIILKKLSFSKNERNKKKFHDKEIFRKVRAARHENKFSVRKVS